MEKQTFTKPEEIKQVISLKSGKELPLSRPLIMGILNVTPDSFSDGNLYTSPEKATERAMQMQSEGADIIDIGGESSRPGAEPVGEQEELDRVIPIIESIRRSTDIPISIDTTKSKVAREAIFAGAEMINDITALTDDPEMVRVVSASKAPVVLMHKQGIPETMQNNPQYENCVEEIISYFEERISFCVDNGIDKSKIILDPGIGFGKSLSHNLEILRNLGTIKKRLSLPVLIGTSRKSFINMIDPMASEADQRLGGSIASAVVAVTNGANIIRVHDIKESVEAMKVLQAIGSIKE